MPFAPPTVTITKAAQRAFRDAAHQAGAGEVLHLTIDAKFHNDLFFGAVEPSDVVVVANELTIAMDSRTARRANGVTIDFVEGPTGVGFKLENPNQSSTIQGVRPADVLHLLRARDKLRLIDVRPEAQRAKAAIDEADPLDPTLEGISKDEKLVLLGHHSSDGRSAAQQLQKRGFRNVVYVVGGIDAWSTLDPSIPRY